MATRTPKLPGRAAWIDERQDARGDLRVLQGLATLRAEHAYEVAAACPACALARAADGEDALCDAHLALALGMQSEWDVPR